MKLKNLIKPLKLDWVGSDVTDDNFPDNGERGKVEILQFNKSLSTEEVLEKMKKMGYRPATLHEMLSWAKEWNRKDAIVALGSIWQTPNGFRRVGCLYNHDSQRELGLCCLDRVWDDHYPFAVVRKSLKSNHSILCPHCNKEIKLVK